MRIFLVENDADTLRVLKRLLERMGHQVTTSINMEDGLSGIPTSNCDVLLSDIGLPDGSGWELMQRVEKSRPFYAIAMSGYGSPADLRASAEAGFRDHLVKPFTREQLLAVLQKANAETHVSAPH